MAETATTRLRLREANGCAFELAFWGTHDCQQILFVDDEPAILDGYRRLLHREFAVDTAAGVHSTQIRNGSLCRCSHCLEYKRTIFGQARLIDETTSIFRSSHTKHLPSTIRPPRCQRRMSSCLYAEVIDLLFQRCPLPELSLRRDNYFGFGNSPTRVSKRARGTVP